MPFSYRSTHVREMLAKSRRLVDELMSEALDTGVVMDPFSGRTVPMGSVAEYRLSVFCEMIPVDECLRQVCVHIPRIYENASVGSIEYMKRTWRRDFADPSDKISNPFTGRTISKRGSLAASIQRALAYSAMEMEHLTGRRVITIRCESMRKEHIIECVRGYVDDGANKICPMDLLDFDLSPSVYLVDDTCVVCLGKPSTDLNLPCGHIATCYSCSERVQSCPVCRQRIRCTVRFEVSDCCFEVASISPMTSCNSMLFSNE